MEIKNLALSDSKGHDLEKEIVVRVTAMGIKHVGHPSSCLPQTQALLSFQFQLTLSFDLTFFVSLSKLTSLPLPRFGCGPRPSL